MEKKLKRIGAYIAAILVLITLIQFLWIWTHDCKIEDINTAPKCIEKLVFLIIPTEVTLVEILSPFPIILLIVLLIYWRYIEPPNKHH